MTPTEPTSPTPNRSARSRRMADQIQAARVLHDNALADADILAQLAQYGCDAPRFAALQTAITRADALVDAQNTTSGKRNVATQAVIEGEREARAVVGRLAAMCRLRFSPVQLTQLGLGRRAPSHFAGFLQYASTLYTAALTLPDIAPVLARSGYPATRLQAEQAQIAALSEADVVQEARKGDAQQATDDQDQAMNTLRALVHDLSGTARIALHDTPQKLEKLGIRASGRR